MFLTRRCFLTRSLNPFYQLAGSTFFKSPRSTNFSSSIDTDTSSALTETKTDEEEMLKFIQLEMSLLCQIGRSMPDPNLIKKDHWDELLTLKTKNARQKFYSFLLRMQTTKENKLRKKQETKQAKECLAALNQSEDHPHIVYSLNETSFFLRIQRTHMNEWRNNRLRHATQFGEKLIFDCSYDEHMTNREAKNAAKQLMLCFAENRKNREPFDLHFCNTNFDGVTMKYLLKHIPTLRNKTFPLNVYEGSYLDLFPKEQLVYLTPHCDDIVTEYDPNMIYIIGAMVDKTNQQPLSLNKAKELNLKMARLPLDKYLDWNSGSGKSLTLNQMTKIMLDVKKNRDWAIALKNVPRRKIRCSDE